MDLIPATCDACGNVTWIPGITLGDATLTIAPCLTRCRYCGAMARVAAGTYVGSPRGTLAFIDDANQAAVVLTALRELQKMAAENVSREVIEKTINEKYPFLDYLKRYLPKDFKELTLAVTIIIAVVNHMRDEASHAPNSLDVQKEISEALRDIDARLRTDQPSSQAPQRE
jgi:hypothetical protein